VALLPQRWRLRWRLMVPTSAYAKIRQIFLAKWFFEDKFPYEGKVRMAGYLLVYGGPRWT
jgi:hypothetical protein